MSQEQRDYYKARYQTLEDIPSVGPATATKLRKLGFKTVEALATAPVRFLTQNGFGEDTAKKMVAAARKGIALEFITAADLHEIHKNKQKMTTGCSTLDRLLNGGLETISITELYSEFGGGKSQICQQLAVTVQLPEAEGGLDGGCLYLDTEHVFRPSRVMKIAEHVGLDPAAVLQRIIYAEAYTSEHQAQLLENADEVIKENNIRLIIIDSLTGHFRSEYLGRENLAPRQQRLNQHMHKLIRLARVFNAVAIVTNQVSATPDSFFVGKAPTAVGGNIVGHIAHTRIFLRKGSHNQRIAKIVASPFLPEGETPFRITAEGIVGTELEEAIP
ncbi:hypothetical protein LCGC14_0980970 [marine sediment metagenome]|uniref:DNA repair and recombination protein RadA n=1 Tax=marine sediment metagenome TaxID=412755 RepID=A0A0F9ND65_9ZZZZ